MIKITKKQWDEVPEDYKGVWSELIVKIHNMNHDWIGRKNVMSQCIGGENGTALLTEGVHFKIID